MRVLIAEDDKDLAEALSALLEKEHFSVETVYDGEVAYDYAATGCFDGVILDVMMPKCDGIEVLKKLRQANVKTPVMLLTAKGEKEDRILGFNAGADDYLPKPFDPDELLARLRAMFRRGTDYIPANLSFYGTELDYSTCTFKCGENSIRLLNKEFQIAELFMRNPNIVISAERIMEKIWGRNSNVEINVVWVNVSNVRKKLRAINSKATIRANRGTGYVLEEDRSK